MRADHERASARAGASAPGRTGRDTSWRPSESPIPTRFIPDHITGESSEDRTLRPQILALSLLSAAGWGALHPAAAQEPGEATAGAVVGRVVDAGTGEGLAGAVVVLEPAPGGLVPTSRGGPAFLATTLSVLTDERGEYRFSGLPSGPYRLRIRRLGYRPATIDLEYRSDDPFRVSIGLTVAPVRLEPVEAAAAAAPYGRADAADGAAMDARIVAERERQERFLLSDVRAVTHADVIDAVTTGETDLFRALHRLPGIVTRDDFTADVYTRGARWSDTRIYFDGLPLFDPVHVLGAFSAVNTDALGAAFLHPGVAPTAIGEGAAAVLDLGSRPGGGRGDLRGVGEVSLLSVRGALDQRLPGERGGWMVAARRLHLDLIAPTYRPYGFFDVSGRFDLRLGNAYGLEVSGMWEEDGVTRSAQGLLGGDEGDWGNRVARASLTGPVGELLARHTVGVSNYSADIRDPLVPVNGKLPPPTDLEITYLLVSGEIEPADGDASWSAGYQVTRQILGYHGPRPEPYPEDLSLGRIDVAAALSTVSIWTERRWRPNPALEFRTGLRAELGSGVRNAGRLRLAPRLTARIHPPGSRLSLSAGYGRSYQYTQALGPAGDGVTEDLYPADVWLLAADTIPAVESDVVTLGTEAWIADAWLAAANLYYRQATGLTVPDPTPGLVTADRPVFVTARNYARGIEVSLRRLTGRWTGSIGYSLGVSDLEAEGLVYAADGDRRHAVDGVLAWQASGTLRLGAAATVASGTPFTRFYIEEADGEDVLLARVGPSGAGRTPVYASVDLLVDWTKRYSGWSLGLYLQVHNALNHLNSGPYDGSFDRCPVAPVADRKFRPNEFGGCDRFEEFVPFLPAVGVRVAF